MNDLSLSTWKDIDPLLRAFLPFKRVLLAVSGGSDSLALLYLAASWVQRHKDEAPTCEVATVDHGLRPTSRAEALEVQRHAEKCGFMHHVLEWHGPKPHASIQARAREERYALMERLVQAWPEERVAIVTAHTCEDQAETVLMRLARGSGPDGLRGIAVRRTLHPSSKIVLLRPLLGIARADLRAWLSTNGIVWAEDPSNFDERFERVKLRQATPTLSGIGLHPNKLALSAERQARAVAALEEATTVLQKECLEIHHGAYGSLQRATFESAPQELRIRLLQRCLTMFRGKSPPAELEQVERLVADVEHHGRLRQTLGGCEVHAKKDVLLVYREVGRASLAPTPLRPGVPVLWDQRFRISLRPSQRGAHEDLSTSDVMVRPLEVSLFRKLRESGEKRYAIPLRAAATLPTVWSGDKLLTIAGLGAGLGIETIRGGQSFALTDPSIHAEFLYSPY